MVQILPRFDPGGEIGKAFGSGISDILKTKTERGMMLNALDSLDNITQEDLQKMSFPEQIKTFIKPFVGLKGGNMMISELMPKILDYMQNMADISPESIEPGMGEAPASLSEEGKRLWHATNKLDEYAAGPKKAQPSEMGDPIDRPSEVAEGAEQKIRGVDPEPLTKVGPSLKGLPNNMPGDLRDTIKNYPEFRAMALRGNPQGLSWDQQTKLVRDLTQQRVPREVAINRVEDLSRFLKTQAGVFQDIQNDVAKEAKKIYGNSPFFNMFQRQMQNEADSQIDAGRLEKNSILNLARERAKSLETIINDVKSQQGRPIFELGLENRKGKSSSWVAPLLRKGEVRTAIELLTQRNIHQKDGKTVPGPDWGPIRATEIALSQVPGNQAIPRARNFAKQLPDVREKKFRGDLSDTRRQQLVSKGSAMIENFLSNQLEPEDSLVLLRGYANEMGYDEDVFNQALEKAKRKRGGEFSEYQNWEESTFLPYNVKPSLMEIWKGLRPFGDAFTGKR